MAVELSSPFRTRFLSTCISSTAGKSIGQMLLRQFQTFDGYDIELEWRPVIARAIRLQMGSTQLLTDIRKLCLRVVEYDHGRRRRSSL
jgi:hypothetical protein